MTVALAQGVLGLDGLHEWTSGGVGNPMFTLNDLNVSLATPRVKALQISGWRSLPEIDSQIVNRYGRIGENSGPLSPRGKSITYDLLMQALVPEDLHTTQWSFLHAFAERSELGTLRVRPKGAPYGDPDDYWWCRARVMGVDLDEQFDAINLHHPRGFWQLSGQVSLHLFDPRFYWTAAVDSGTGAGPHTVVNTGFVEADPYITFTCAADASVIITNDTTGDLLSLAHVPADTWIIDFGARNITKVGDSSVTALPNLFAEDSTWWHPQRPGIIPGSNHISATGVTNFRVQFNPASY